MSYAIVFSSKTGNTKLLADTLHACLPQENCCYFGTPDPAAMEADDLYVGFWTDKGNADESTLDFLKQLHGKNVFLFGTAGFGGSEEYFNKILKKSLWNAVERKQLSGLSVEVVKGHAVGSWIKNSKNTSASLRKPPCQYFWEK